MKLCDIPLIESEIKGAKSNTTKLVHEFIVNSDKNKRNHRNSKNFEGFSYGVGDMDFEKKISDSTENFTKLQLINITNFF